MFPELRIQEMHITIGHTICDLVEERLVQTDGPAECSD
jgi:hypothetical protein